MSKNLNLSAFWTVFCYFDSLYIKKPTKNPHFQEATFRSFLNLQSKIKYLYFEI